LQRAFKPLPLNVPLSLYNKAIHTDKERGKEKDKNFQKAKQQLQGAGVGGGTPAPIILSKERINFTFGKRFFVV